MTMSICQFSRGFKMPLLNRVLLNTSQKFVRWKYRAVIFDMGGVILPSPFPMTKGGCFFFVSSKEAT